MLTKRVKNNIIIGIITLFILFLDFISYPIFENITYYEMIKDQFFLIAYLYPFLLLGAGFSFWIELIILFVMVISIILINMKKKYFHILFFTYYFYIFIYLLE